MLKAWVLDAHMENFVRIKAESFDASAFVGDKEEALSFFAVADSVTGETVGNTSYFEARAGWLKSATEFMTKVQALDIRGTKFENVTFQFPSGEAIKPQAILGSDKK